MSAASEALADVHGWLCDNLSGGDAGKVCGMLSAVSRHISALEDENVKLKERVEWLDGECRKSMSDSHKFFEMVGKYQKENAKLWNAVEYLYGFAKTLGVGGDSLREEFGIEVDG